MIKEIYYHMSLQDKSCSLYELKAINGINLLSYEEKGSLGKIGRNANKILDYNSIVFNDDSDNLNIFLKFINSNEVIMNLINKVEYKELYLYVETDEQCNIEISFEEVELLKKLGIGISISIEKQLTKN